MEAARLLFESQGYFTTNVNDISAEAGVAYGTFYIYFSSKEDVFGEVVKELQQQFRAIAAGEPHVGTDPASHIERANRGFLRAYQQTASMQRVLEQASTINPQQEKERREANLYWRERARKAIVDWQFDGVVDRDIDAFYAANALGAMVDRYAYLWFVLGQEHDFDEAVEQLTHLYCNALGIRHKITPRDDRP